MACELKISNVIGSANSDILQHVFGVCLLFWPQFICSFSDFLAEKADGKMGQRGSEGKGKKNGRKRRVEERGYTLSQSQGK